MTCITRQPTLHCPKRTAMPSFRLSSLKLPISSSMGDQNHMSHKPTTDSTPLQKISSGPNSRSLSAAVIRLRKAELAQELQLRGLPDTGTRQDLRARLLEVIEDDQRVTTGALNSLTPLLTCTSLHKCQGCNALYSCRTFYTARRCLARRPAAASKPITTYSSQSSCQHISSTGSAATSATSATSLWQQAASRSAGPAAAEHQAKHLNRQQACFTTVCC